MAKDIEVEIFLKGGNKLQNELRDVSGNTKRAEAGFSKLGARIVTFNSAIGIAAAGARAFTAAIGPVIQFGQAALEAASDFEEANAKFNTVFENLTTRANGVRDEFAASFGQSRQAATELLAGTGDLLTGFGFLDDEALELSQSVNELAVDLASFQNLSGGAEQASNALTKALLGERETLKTLGVVINEVNVQDELRKRGQEELTGLALRRAMAEATFALILEQTGKAQGDFARTSQSLANQQRILTAQVEDLSTALGDVLVPIAQVVIRQLTSIAGNTLEWVEANKALLASGVIDFASAFANGLNFASIAVGRLVQGISFLAGITIQAGAGALELAAKFVDAFDVVNQVVAGSSRIALDTVGGLIRETKLLLLNFQRDALELVSGSEIFRSFAPPDQVNTVRNALEGVKTDIERVQNATSNETAVTFFDEISEGAKELSEGLRLGRDAAIETTLGLEGTNEEIDNFLSKLDAVNERLQSGFGDVQVGIDRQGNDFFGEEEGSGSEAEDAFALEQAKQQRRLDAIREANEEEALINEEKRQQQLEKDKEFFELLSEEFDVAQNKFREQGEFAIQGFRELAVGAFGQTKAAADDLFFNLVKGTGDSKKAFEQLGNSLLKSVISALTKIAIQELIFSKISGQTTANRNTGIIASESAKGGAAAFASVLAALPFPINIVTAPIVAATQSAAIAAFSAGAQASRFQQGLDVVQGARIPAILDRGETVLTATETSNLRELLGDTSDNIEGVGGQGGAVNVVFDNLQIVGAEDEAVQVLTNALRFARNEVNLESI